MPQAPAFTYTAYCGSATGERGIIPGGLSGDSELPLAELNPGGEGSGPLPGDKVFVMFDPVQANKR